LARIFGFVLPYRRLMLTAFLLLPVASALELAQPLLLRRAIDQHIAVGKLAGLGTLAAMYLALLLGQYPDRVPTALRHADRRPARDERSAAAAAPARSVAVGVVLRSHAAGTPDDPADQRHRIALEMFAAGLVTLVGDFLKLGFISS